MNETIVYYDLVKKALEQGSFRLGYRSVSKDITDTELVDLWFSGYTVIATHYASGLVSKVQLCNNKKSCSYYNNKAKQVLNELKVYMSSVFEQPPSVLNTFENIIFESYDSNTDKFNQLMSALPKFDEEFKQLFKTEIESMTSANTQVAVMPELFQWYKCKKKDFLNPARETYGYVSAVYENTVLLKSVKDSIGEVKTLDLREVMNDYVEADCPPNLHKLCYKLCDTLPDIFNSKQVIKNLNRLQYQRVDSIYKINDTFNFGKDNTGVPLEHIDTMGGRRLAIHYDQCDFTVFIHTGIMTIVSLSQECSSNIENDVFKNIVKPNEYLGMSKEVISRTIRIFSPILCTTELQLKQYLDSLLLALEEVEEIVINSRSTWDDYPEYDNKEVGEPARIETDELSSDELAMYDCIPEATRSSYGSTVKEIVRNFLKNR